VARPLKQPYSITNSTMTVSSVLDTLRLDARPPDTSRQIIAEGLWNLVRPMPIMHGDGSYESELCDLYFGNPGYYAEQCSLFDYGSFTSIKTHRQILHVALLLRKSRPRPELLQLVSHLLGKADPIHHDMSVNLVVRLMLMIKVGIVPHEGIGGSLEWKTGSLQDFVHQQFPATGRRSHERLKLEKTFTALNLHRIAGVEIKWTDDLTEHLQVMNDDKMIAVFRHASFLKAQLHK